MSYIDVIWTVIESALATLGFIHLYIWYRNPPQVQYLLFFLMSLSICVVCNLELRMVQSTTPEIYAKMLRFAHVPLTVGVIALVGFIRRYLNTGRTWLAVSVCAARLAALAANFATGVNLNFTAISAVRRVVLPGAAVVSTPIGTLNPWWRLAQLGNLLLVAFVVDSSIDLWRRGDAQSRRQALVVGGGFALCVSFVVIWSLLLFSGNVRGPSMVAPAFFIVVTAMGFELGQDVLRAGELSRNLRESEQRIDLASQAAQLAFWTWEPATGRCWINETGCRLFGLPVIEQTTVENLIDRVHPDDRTEFRDQLERTKLKGGTLEREFRVHVPDDPPRWLATRAVADGAGAQSGGMIRGVVLDITRRVRMQEELLTQNRKLAQASKLSSLGVLAGSIAHEVNQPLASILANAEAAEVSLQRADPKLSELRDILKDIIEADKRAGEVIRRLWELLRNGQVDYKPLMLNHVVQDALRLMRVELRNRAVETTLDLAPDLPSVTGDAVQLQQVLINLLMNGCEAMEGLSDGRRLWVGTRLTPAREVEVSVGDAGPGIAAADRKRIFESFITTKPDGLGLGLSICHAIVTAHGGRLWVDESSGPGATLRFALPAARGRP